ncbi:MAG: DoxX family membrane protein [Planctomycetia bacterium]|nr:DoxX family membrane protein [Planctomycetia bacterium]
MILYERRFPLKRQYFRIGMLSVILLVALRLSIGWHFLYEGVWKVDNSDTFSALPFLTLSKGPFAPIFYAMAPDLDGKLRLKAEGVDATWHEMKDVKVDVVPNKDIPEGVVPEVKSSYNLEEKSGTIAVYPAYYKEVEKIYHFAMSEYKPDENQKKELQVAWGKYVLAEKAAVEADAEGVSAYLEALKRFEDAKNAGNNGPEQMKRLWADMLKLRREAADFLSVQESLAKSFRNQLYTIFEEQQKVQPLPEFVVATDLLPFGLNLPFVGKSWTNFLNFAVTWALTLIGACLVLGFCTRLAAIGGGCFLISVLMTQPPWPAIFPPVHPEVGHALVVDKNFVEMVAIFMLATLPVGRWGGLDFFVWHWLGKPIFTSLGWYVEEEA